MNKFWKALKKPLEIIKIIARFEPWYFVFSVPQILLSCIITVATIYYPKQIIECLTSGKNYTSVINVILQYGFVMIILKITDVILKSKSNFLASEFAFKLKQQVGENAMQLPLKDIEAIETQKAIDLATHASELINTISAVEGIITDFVVISGFVWIIARLDFRLIMLLGFTLIVKLLLAYISNSFNKKSRMLETDNNRVGDYLNHVSFFNEGAEKELRLNSLTNWFMSKTMKYRENMLKIEYREYKFNAIINVLSGFLASIQLFVVLYYLSKLYINNAISIADFTMYFYAISTLTYKLSSIGKHMYNYRHYTMNYNDYVTLITKSNNIASNTVDSLNRGKAATQVEIVLHNVSFCYPNTSKPALKNINLTIHNMEKLVVVGNNGSGKSTLIKLLCKFYRPTSGTITLNGMDIWSIPNNSYFATISAVFQDYTNFAFSLKENISMEENANVNEIKSITEILGLSKSIQRMSKGYDTFLTRQFDSDGIELSGGESQKLAIARAIYKKTPILFLDEPTANLDPKAECEIYTDLFHAVEDKTAIFISHRLAASSIADNIAVLHDGELVEYGSHASLMTSNALYAKMYRSQSKEYLKCT